MMWSCTIRNFDALFDRPSLKNAYENVRYAIIFICLKLMGTFDTYFNIAVNHMQRNDGFYWRLGCCTNKKKLFNILI